MVSANFTPKSILPVNPSARKIFKSFSPQNYEFILTVIKGILSLIDFSPDGKIHYKLQSPSGQLLINERALLDKLNVEGLFSYYGEDGVFGIVTLGNINVKVLRKLELYLTNATQQPEIKSVNIAVDEPTRQREVQSKQSSELQQRYTRLLGEITSRQKSPDLEERYKQLINEIKGGKKNLLVTNQNQTETQLVTDLTDTASRKGYEKKWDVLQAIWSIYVAQSRPDSILVPVASLTIKGRGVQFIDGIVEGLKKDGLFQKWNRQDRWYDLEFINHERLPKAYQEIGNTYKKFGAALEAEREGSTKEPSATKIEIIKMPELQIEGLKEIAKAKKRDDKPKFPYKLPAGTRWEQMIIKFLDDENIFIQIKQFKCNANYKDMGFVGKGNDPNPSEAWTFLKVLAQVNGELTIKDTKARDKYKKQKEFLAKSLQSYFSLDYDPFYPYRSSSEKSGNSYKVKMTLISPPDTKKKTNTDENGNDNLGIKEYLDEQNPQVYEDR